MIVKFYEESETGILPPRRVENSPETNLLPTGEEPSTTPSGGVPLFLHLHPPNFLNNFTGSPSNGESDLSLLV